MELIIILVILYLLFGRKKKKQKTKQQPSTRKKTAKTNASGERMDRLTPDGELPYGWVYANRDFKEKLDNEARYFYNEYHENMYGEPKKKYAALKSLILYLSDTRKRCAKMGECYLFYFTSMWAKEDEVQQLKEELKYLEDHFDEIEKEYKKRQYIEHILIPDLKKKSIKIIKDNPGIVQTEVYSHFEPEVKKHVQDAIYQLNREGKIHREKQGRTYKLYT